MDTTNPTNPPMARRAAPDAFGNGAPHGNGHGDGQQRQHPQHPQQGDRGHDAHALEEIPRDLPKIGTGTMLVVGLVIVGILVGLFFLGYIPHHAAVKAAADEKAALKDARPAVGVDHPVRPPTSGELTLPGDARAMQETSIYARANGYLSKLFVDIGDHVTKDQPLAEIATPEVDAQLEGAKASVQLANANVIKAQTDFELAQSTLQRFEGLSKTGGVTKQQLDEKQSAFSQAQSALEGAKASVASANAEVQRLSALQSFEHVTAPFDGTVTTRIFDLGALITPANPGAGREMFRIEKTDTLRVWVKVPQGYVTDIRPGTVADFMVRNFPGKAFPGSVTRTAGAIDPNMRTLQVQVDVPNKEGQLFGGMYGQVRFHLQNEQPPFTVPTSALVFAPDGTKVAVVGGNGKVHFQPVVVGRDFGTKVEVTQGVNGTERIIANPGEHLAEGIDVRIVSDTAEQPPIAAPPVIRTAEQQARAVGSPAPTTHPAATPAEAAAQ